MDLADMRLLTRLANGSNDNPTNPMRLGEMVGGHSQAWLTFGVRYWTLDTCERASSVHLWVLH